MADNKKMGKAGEVLAAEALEAKGYYILRRNYTCPYGEIDIIAIKNKVISFIEVKTRTQEKFGNPLEAITKSKLKSIFLCSRYYLQNCKKRYSRTQIDAIGILLNKDNQKIDFIENISL